MTRGDKRGERTRGTVRERGESKGERGSEEKGGRGREKSEGRKGVRERGVYRSLLQRQWLVSLLC
jgi:hypothetical protein